MYLSSYHYGQEPAFVQSNPDGTVEIEVCSPEVGAVSDEQPVNIPVAVVPDVVSIEVKHVRFVQPLNIPWKLVPDDVSSAAKDVMLVLPLNI